MKKAFLDFINQLQEKITTSIEDLDSEAKFIEDVWERPEGGGGKSRIMENGKIFEKAGVNISAVSGVLPKSLEGYFDVKDSKFFACGLSLVFHPKNPMIPTCHFMKLATTKMKTMCLTHHHLVLTPKLTS